MSTYDDWTGGAINLASSWRVRDPNHPGQTMPSPTAPGQNDDLSLTGGGTIRGGEGGFASLSAAYGSYTLVGTLNVKYASFLGALSMTKANVNAANGMSVGGGALTMSGSSVKCGAGSAIYFGDSTTDLDAAPVNSLTAGSLLQATLLKIGGAISATLNLDASTITITGEPRQGMSTGLFVGDGETSDRLNATNGSRISAPEMSIAANSAASIMGADTTVSLTGADGLSLEFDSALQIGGGASVSTTGVDLGEDSGSKAPTLVVADAGTSFQVTSGYTDVANGVIQVAGGATFQGGQATVIASYAKTNAEIDVTSGGRFVTRTLQMGTTFGASHASVIVDGAGSQLQVQSQLFFGGANSSMSVTRGGAVLVGTDARIVKNTVSVGQSGTIQSIADNTLECALNIDGTFDVARGTFKVAGVVSGTGTIKIGASSTFEMSKFGSTTRAPACDFGGTKATLMLDGSYSDQMLTIKNFQADDNIVFNGMSNLTTFAVQKNGTATGEVEVYSGMAKLASLYFAPSVALKIEPITSGQSCSIRIDTSTVAATQPQLENSDVVWSFVDKREGNRLAPYVLEKDHSGVTIGIGSDLPNGPITQADLKALFGADITANRNLAILFAADSAGYKNIYRDKTKSNDEKIAAGVKYLQGACLTQTISGTYDTVTSISSSITTAQANAISNKTKELELGLTIEKWKGFDPAVSFAELPKEAQTVLLDLVYNRGSIPTAVATTMLAAAKNITDANKSGRASDWAKVYDAVATYSTTDPSRRSAEAALIKQIHGATTPTKSMAVASGASDTRAFGQALFEGAFGQAAFADASRIDAASQRSFAAHEALAIHPHPNG